ncbi:hypothetical protein J7J00_17825 [Bacillus sp. ISL-4]|uniref:fibronectin type III domain-containing protein n=1 Tax=Bacillus sp. ISL-4 TaxID=2819125 RepID=UPI001BE6535E|nr:fibronectin type III domain-containing protein [Bacillus sp. ISL-4]MBT2667339.1 hypothetical protein [Bacillus sp. ISL-4]MBT2669425.1 hypothetical protein [Streptomyces sp. ISL-14]
MEQFNIFQIPNNDFKNMMNLNGAEVFVNGSRKYALISNNSAVKEFNDKYISTDFNMNRGDIVFYDSKYWMLTTQVGTPRYESYKANMRMIEHEVFFNLSSMNTPPDDFILKTPAIVQQTTDFGLEYTRTAEIISVHSEIHVFVQDNAKTRNLLKISNTSSGSIIFGDRVYKIIGVSTVNKGVLDVTCNFDGKANVTDRESGVYQTPANLEDVTDTTMFGLERDFVLNEYQSQVTPLTHTITNASANANGSIVLTWKAEANRNEYVGFEGYEVRLLKDNVEYMAQHLGENIFSHTFNVPEGNYIAEVYSKFSTLKSDESTLPARTESMVVAMDTGTPLPPSTLGTNVGNINTTPTDSEYYQYNGKLHVAWDREANADNYAGFAGYEIVLGWYMIFGGESVQQTIEVGDVTQYEFTNLTPNAMYFVRFRSKFVNEGQTFYASMQESETVSVEEGYI